MSQNHLKLSQMTKYKVFFRGKTSCLATQNTSYAVIKISPQGIFMVSEG